MTIMTSQLEGWYRLPMSHSKLCTEQAHHGLGEDDEGDRHD
ncbi:MULTISPECIES: hypothetical protein [Nostocales]|uniref:Uncharacterized protein n=1 Tax=Chrysosporum bergii ANA360D TaxID=617107 RepID=A0AA43KB41_9CYAN|nr:MULTISPECIES: hypothetical protein [Aphanizomenonaceae]MDH6060146.1 hypothetical protein [Chrysosporum bergii ANA360D]